MTKTNSFRNLTGLLCLCIAVLSGSIQINAQERASLENTNWQLVKMVVLGGFEFVPDDPAEYVINFRSDSRLTGTSDCNDFVGSWFQEGASLHFKPFAPSRKLCEPGSLHNNFTLLMRNVDASEMRGQHLVLTTTTDGLFLEFEAR